MKMNTKTVGAFEAKTHLSELLDLAAMGERFTITKRGKPVAMLVPLEEEPHMTAAEAVTVLKEIRSRVTLGTEVTVKDLVEEGRRW
jgi:prevent-host-death family protein